MTLSIESGGREVLVGTTRVKLAKMQPNGPECPPSKWAVAFAAGDESLVVRRS